MKSVYLFLIFAVVAISSVRGQRAFHEHYEDFEILIVAEVGEELQDIIDQYFEFDDFTKTLRYLLTKDFIDLVYEMESLPEFIAVVEFLEKDNIDILYFIDILNLTLDSINVTKRRIARKQLISGTDFNAYMTDVTAALPKAKLQDLFNQKMEEDQVFRTSLENLYSDEWNQIFSAFINSPGFQKEAELLAEHGVDVGLFFEQVIAIFGQL